MILVLPEEKKNKIVEQCQFLLKKTLVAIRELSQIIGRLASSASTSTIPSSATSANNGVFHGERQRSRDRLIR